MPDANHAAQPSCDLRGKPGSSSPTAATATDTPSAKSSGQPALPFVSPASTPKPKPSAAPAVQADGASHTAEKALPAHSDSSASSTPVQLAALPESSASGQCNAALLRHNISAHKLPQQQISNRSSHDATAELPVHVPKVTGPATCQVNAAAEPGGSAAATTTGVHLSMLGVNKHSVEAAAAIPQVPQSNEGVGKEPDSLPMVRRLPAVLTSTLPTLEGLGVQVNLPSGADMLSKVFFCCNKPAQCYDPMPYASAVLTGTDLCAHHQKP